MCLAVPGKVIALHPGGRADVDFGGVVRVVQMDLLPGVAIGAYVIVHAGFAIHEISAEDAAETRALFAEMQDAPHE